MKKLRKLNRNLKIPNCTQEEQDYLAGLQIRLERERNDRELKHDEFDGMTYSEYFESNEKGANMTIKLGPHRK